MDAGVTERLASRLARLYGAAGHDVLPRLLSLMDAAPADDTAPARAHRGETERGETERDVVLITYADTVRRPGVPPLATLRAFLQRHGWHRFLNTVHLLPFYPSSSDDGFSVTDHRAVDPGLGTWDDVAALAGDDGPAFELMFDLVLNHASRQGAWFADFERDQGPGARFFLEADPDRDLSDVRRPRAHPLLTPVDTSRGRRHVWTTFSPDQVDLDWRNPDVLLEMVDIALLYARRGARILRLDAVAYLWKQPGTSCIHRPETHEIVKLLRDVLAAAAPGTRLITETNVPHAENVSYFGDGDEAHMVYQFSLAPLLLDALRTGDEAPLVSWLADLTPPPPGATFLNFTASHDGIGLQPLEGLLPEARVARLAAEVEALGGRVGRRDGGGSYELNATYYSALGGHPRQHERFIASQAVMLALAGVPAVYVHSLLGTPNDEVGVAATGRARSINRRRYAEDEIEALLTDPSSEASRVGRDYRRLLAARIAEPAFHPAGPQQVLETGAAGVLALRRTRPDGSGKVLVLANLRDAPAQIPGDRAASAVHDLLDPSDPGLADGAVALAPYQCRWLVLES